MANMTLSVRSKRVIAYFTFVQVIMCCGYCFAQTPGTNYLRTRIPQIAVTDTASLDTIPVQRQAVSIQYMDGLGRTLQSIQVQGSPGYKDVIKSHYYDNMGREVISFLPYADESTDSLSAGLYRNSALLDVLNFYSPLIPGAPFIPTDLAPYSQTVYELSPLGRVIEQGEAGVISQPGTGHTVRASYQVNSAADSINYYYNIVEGSSLSVSPFNSGTLTKTIITDENGHRLALWKDMQGRTVTRAELDAPTPYYSTDYVYNDLDQLSDIITPAGKKKLADSAVQFALKFVKQAYIFHYDSIGRPVEKKIPGKGWIYTIYNQSDRPVLAQDSNMRVKNQWTFMKYDAEGRIVETGMYINTIITSRKAMQYLCDSSYPILWETWQAGVGYTDNAFPQNSAIPGSSPLAVYALFYYDDYSFTEAAAKPFQTNIYGNTPTLRTMGMLTGVSVYVLGTSSQYLVTVNYYDKQNRLIQQIDDNHLGQVDVVNNLYNFVGEVTASQRIITPTAGNVFNIKDRYVYDQMGRLLDTYESFRGSAEIDISHNVYNEISQKVREGLHSTNYSSSKTITYTGPPPMPGTIAEDTTITAGQSDIAGGSVTLSPDFSFTATSGNTYLAGIGNSFAQVQEFRYTIKGQLASINNGTLTYDNGVTQSDPYALFGESITYSETSPIGASPQYNGNISGLTWRNKIEESGLPSPTTGPQGYAFTYDNVDRLAQTTYYTNTGSWTPSTSGALTERIGHYDEMGNIDSLQRKDKNGNSLNTLGYTYQDSGNQLLSVNDAGSQNISGSFTYDGNGNMTSDTHKNITVTYNYLDLPDTVKQSTSELVFTYDAMGNKLYKQLITAGTVVSQRHYIDDAELVATSSVAYDGHVESIAMDEGRIVNTTGNNYIYEYYLQDHLYNNRVAFRADTLGNVTLSQVQNYYPFGADMGDSTMNYALTPINQYKYSGKEWQPELNLNTYDFGARHYEPILARWMVIDPLAEESADLSPYDYVANNPMNFTDPDGMQYTSLGNGNVQWGTGQMEMIINGGARGAGSAASSASSSLGVAGVIINGVLQGINAYHAFGNWWDVKTPNFTGLKDIEQDQNSVSGPKVNASQSTSGLSAVKGVHTNHVGRDPKHLVQGFEVNFSFAFLNMGGTVSLGGIFNPNHTGEYFFSSAKPVSAFEFGGGAQYLLGVTKQSSIDVSGDGYSADYGMFDYSGSYMTDSFTQPSYRIFGHGVGAGFQGLPPASGGLTKSHTWAIPALFLMLDPIRL